MVNAFHLFGFDTIIEEEGDEVKDLPSFLKYLSQEFFLDFFLMIFRLLKSYLDFVKEKR